jgi:hypothetical protein
MFLMSLVFGRVHWTITKNNIYFLFIYSFFIFIFLGRYDFHFEADLTWADLNWGRFDWGDLTGADLTWGRFDWKST